MTSVRRISTETRGWNVSPATVILWGWTRTGLSVTGGQEHASVWKVGGDAGQEGTFHFKLF